jgi:hypothetical protein
MVLVKVQVLLLPPMGSRGLQFIAYIKMYINLLAPELLFLNFSTPVYKMCIKQETKYVRIMKQTAF